MSNVTGPNGPGGIQSTETDQTPTGSPQNQNVSSEDASHFANLMSTGGSPNNAAGQSVPASAQNMMEQLQQLFNQQQMANQLPDLGSLPALVGGPAQPGSTGPTIDQQIAELLQQLSDLQQSTGQAPDVGSPPAGPAGPAQPGSTGPAPGQGPTEYLEQLFQQQQAEQTQNGGDE